MDDRRDSPTTGVRYMTVTSLQLTTFVPLKCLDSMLHPVGWSRKTRPNLPAIHQRYWAGTANRQCHIQEYFDNTPPWRSSF